MNSNYAAQNHLARERLAARRQQAEVERLLRQERHASVSGLQHFIMSLFQRSGQRVETEPVQQAPAAARANA